MVPNGTPRSMDLPRSSPKAARPRIVVWGAAATAVVLLAIAWANRKPELEVEVAALLIDTAKVAPFGRDARVPGNLVAEHVDWVTAQASARVERIVVRVGDDVVAGAVLLYLTNPDVEIQALQAEHQARQAERDAFDAHISFAQQRITQQGAIATLRTQWQNAQQDLLVADSLLQHGLASTLEGRSKRALFTELETRLDGEQSKLRLLRESEFGQIAFLKGQADRLRSIAKFQSARLAALTVRAPTSGVVQELSLQSGQWTPEGSILAKIVLPGALKAVLRVPETQASEIQIGQSVIVDTRNGVAHGFVSTKAPAVQSGIVTVDVPLRGKLPSGAVADLAVDGTIELEKPRPTLVIARPSGARVGQNDVYILDESNRQAVRTVVSIARMTATRAEVVAGLRAGDRIVVSDVASWGAAPRVRLSHP